MARKSTALVVMGALAGLVGMALLAGGAVLVWAHTTQRDAAGFYTSSTQRFSTSTAALQADVDLGRQGRERDWVPFADLATIRIRAASTAETPLFIGIGRRADVDRYLAGTAHEQLVDVRFRPFRASYQLQPGNRSAGAPGAEPIWVVSASGTGRQQVTWPTQSGRWSLVVMNAGGGPGVTVDASVGARTGALLPVGIGLGAFGLVLCAGGLLLVVVGVRPAGAPLPLAAAAPLVAGAYPARLDGHLDAGVSRWRWLVKWLLVIPHLVVLALLWMATAVLTVVAGFAILITGRYPRSIFDFNVGVMRWTWRVAFYGISALGTDRYPPFSLDPDPGYPADFSVDYPERLSRGLVLVKWWLLAIPHYVVVAFFAGGATAGFGRWYVVPGGLITVLVAVAAVVLLFSGRYPEPIFGFVMGMNRWCYRVLAYVALLRDEYPPFRLDAGGADPGSIPDAPPPAPEAGGALVPAQGGSAT
ncbi:MAG TPA: DUF4389 domain-containing protein [Acidimicrobiales bacterium]|nr:DUF4389 domain-containing protein [Acidimicrobiales bacterium]